MATGTLNARTQYLLANRPRLLTYERIAREIDLAGLSVDWLTRYATDRCKNAPVDYVQALYEYLAKDILVIE